MTYRLLADLVVLVHFGAILFILFGGLVVLRYRRMAYLHLPCVAWGVAVEVGGWICPLTPLENRLRAAAGDAGYSGGFVEHYLIPVIYPGSLTREVQLLLGGVVLAVNLAVYGWVISRTGRSQAGRR